MSFPIPSAGKVAHKTLFGKVPGEFRGTEEQQEELIDPPIEVSDDYYWLRDDSRTATKVLQHIDEENNYTTSVLSAHTDLNSSLYKVSMLIQ